MFHMPMSSPMMTTMLGFCCAAAGTLMAPMAMNEASRASCTFLEILIYMSSWLGSESTAAVTGAAAG